jgi:hypothetical protein
MRLEKQLVETLQPRLQPVCSPAIPDKQTNALLQYRFLNYSPSNKKRLQHRQKFLALNSGQSCSTPLPVEMPAYPL